MAEKVKAKKGIEQVKGRLREGLVRHEVSGEAKCGQDRSAQPGHTETFSYKG